MPWEPERGERYSGPVAAFLIQLDDGTNVLVDTGLSRDHIEDPEARIPQPDVVVRMTPEDDIRHQLSLIGIAPDDVDYVVVTHFDFDHCGGNRFFPDATFVVQREQYEYAKATPGRCFPQDWDLPELHYRLVEGDLQAPAGVLRLTRLSDDRELARRAIQALDARLRDQVGVPDQKAAAVRVEDDGMDLEDLAWLGLERRPASEPGDRLAERAAEVVARVGGHHLEAGLLDDRLHPAQRLAEDDARRERLQRLVHRGH